MPTPMTGRPSVTPTVATARNPIAPTPYTGRPQGGGVTNTVAPIITGIWNDSLTWSELGKFWNDSGDIAGLVTPIYTGRIIP